MTFSFFFQPPDALARIRRLKWLFFFFPFIFLVLLVVLLDATVSHGIEFLKHSFFWGWVFFSWWLAYGCAHLKRWVGWGLLIFEFFLILNLFSFFRAYSETYHPAVALPVLLFIGFLSFLYAVKKIRVPYFFPKIRWWENVPRYRLSVPLSFFRDRDSQQEQGKVLDISLGGLFLKTSAFFQEGEVLSFAFDVYGFQVRGKGKVIWLAPSAITYPRGVGIQFFPLAKVEKQNLRLILKKLKRLSRHYRRNRYWMSPELFLKRWEDIEHRS